MDTEPDAAATRRGEALRKIRTDADITQEELAPQAVLSVATIRNIEYGKTVRSSTIRKFRNGIEAIVRARNETAGMLAAVEFDDAWYEKERAYYRRTYRNDPATRDFYIDRLNQKEQADRDQVHATRQLAEAYERAGRRLA